MRSNHLKNGGKNSDTLDHGSMTHKSRVSLFRRPRFANAQQLVSPAGNPVTTDRVMELYKWVLHLASKSSEEIAVAGIGRPTYPVDLNLTIAAEQYWADIHEKADKALQDLKESELEFESSSDGSAAISYSAPNGDPEARQRIAEGLSRFYQLDDQDSIKPEDVLFTVGGAMGLHIFFRAINANQPNGRIITPSPFYPLHRGAEQSNRLHVIDVMKLPGYRLTADALAAEIAAAKKLAQQDGGKISAFIFSYPNNPTGQILQREEWEKIAAVIRNDPDLKETYIVLDEAYIELQLDGKYESLFQAAPDLRDRIVVIRSATKAFSAAGERMAVVVCKNHAFLEQLESLQTARLGHASVSSCHAYAAALYHFNEETHQNLVAFYAPKVNSVCEGLKAIGASMPDESYRVDGTFYVMADLSEFIDTPMFADAQQAFPGVKTIESDEHLAYHLLFKEKLMVAPLSYFGVDPRKGYIRITCSDEKHIEYLLARLDKALKELRESKCVRLLSEITEKINTLHQAAPDIADELIRDFNQQAQGLITFGIRDQQLVCDRNELSTLELKTLHERLRRMSWHAGAEVIKNLGHEAQAAMKIKKLLMENANRNQSQRFSANAEKAWYAYVDNFVDEKDRTAKKRLSLHASLKEYPKWRLFYHELNKEYLEKGYDSKVKSQHFYASEFIKGMINREKEEAEKNQPPVKLRNSRSFSFLKSDIIISLSADQLFKKIVSDLSGYLKEDRLYISMTNIIDALNKVYAIRGEHLYYSIVNLEITEDNYEAVHRIFLEFVRDGNERIVEAFLKNKGLNPHYVYHFNAQDQVTALSEAAYYGHKNLVKKFIRMGVDCNTTNTSLSPFLWAVRKGYVEVIKVFLKEKSYQDLIRTEKDERNLVSVARMKISDRYLDPEWEKSRRPGIEEMIEILTAAREQPGTKLRFK